MQRLVLRHQPGEGAWTFVVQRVDARGAKSAPAVAVEDPLTLALPGTGQRLGSELTWYLENYLDYPYAGNAIRAERVQSALSDWGERAFGALLGKDQARDFYRDATRDGHTALHLQIVSDDPRVLSWPWEALRDPRVGNLAQHCRIERQLDSAGDPLPLLQNLSREHVNILLVTARPYRNDVAYRSISRPLVELIQSERLPASVKVLRPPTFDELRRELRKHGRRTQLGNRAALVPTFANDQNRKSTSLVELANAIQVLSTLDSVAQPFEPCKWRCGPSAAPPMPRLTP